jgi:2-hydroxychromene-2-carboxylate isomerase
MPKWGATMDATKPIEFWFTMGSTYSYLTVMRLPDLEKASGIPFRWRPFHLLTILQEMKHVPFADKPAKAAYMWRDIERRAQMYEIPIRVPAPYPVKQSIIANHVALVGFTEGWGKEFVRAAYRRWFQLGQETGSEPNLSGSIADIGENPDRVLSQAGSGAIAAMLERETSAARGLGIFGSPTFATGGEIFWGDDRLDDAISWYRYGSVRHRA